MKKPYRVARTLAAITLLAAAGLTPLVALGCDGLMDSYQGDYGDEGTGDWAFTCYNTDLCVEYAGPEDEIDSLMSACSYDIADGRVCSSSASGCCKNTSGDVTQWTYWYGGQSLSCSDFNGTSCL